MPGRATPQERHEWWPKVLAAYDKYRVYQSNSDRVIPVVFLDPVTPGRRVRGDRSARH